MEPDETQTIAGLQGLEWRTWVYFLMAVAVLPISLIVIVLVYSLSQHETSGSLLVFGLLGLVGFVNTCVAFAMLLPLRRDIAALAVAASPSGATLGGSEGPNDSFWTSTR